ncbi:MAG TPA: hypothetical protein HPP81_01470 [Deltaproteobacteria bacterium]|nr:hypothetical protein [Deltaproteobacteria bacterium]
MLIRHQKTMNIGLLLGVTFFGILALIFSPIFGGGKNGLEYSDALFNKLAKGSSYFVPKLTGDLKGVEEQELAVSVKMEDADQAARAAKIFARVAPDTVSQGVQLSIRGNLSKLLGAVLEDSNSMYFNKGDEVREKYGIDEKEVMTTWWAALNRAVKELQKSRKTEQSNIILEVMKKGIEPAYNFYKIEPQSISEKAFTATGLLVFYVLYTLWWGFAIFYLFDGLGLSMKKARVKREV